MGQHGTLPSLNLSRVGVHRAGHCFRWDVLSVVAGVQMSTRDSRWSPALYCQLSSAWSSLGGGGGGVLNPPSVCRVSATFVPRPWAIWAAGGTVLCRALHLHKKWHCCWHSTAIPFLVLPTTSPNGGPHRSPLFVVLLRHPHREGCRGQLPACVCPARPWDARPLARRPLPSAPSRSRRPSVQATIWAWTGPLSCPRRCSATPR